VSCWLFKNKTVMYSSILFYAAVVEFAIGVVERAMRDRVNPLLLTCVIYSNVGIFYCLLTDVKTHY
jgi:hypothetical protein